MVQDIIGVGEAAREISSECGQQVNPRAITSLFYEGELRSDLCPIIAGRRLIPRSYLPAILMALRRRGVVRNGCHSGEALR